MSNLIPATLSKKILDWYDSYGRQNLPWQQDKTPYRVWISEIMLQQTQVSTVIPYYLRFINFFPTIETLANATEDNILHLWTGLGYYNRARNLHKTAKIITQEYQGKFPDSVEALQSLPGIGLSTAGAIAAIAFQKQATILDGNVKRVLARLYAIKEWPGEKDTLNQLWILAKQMTPKKRVADYTQAIMDLGATLCTRGEPRCNDCPLMMDCKAYQLGLQKTLPQSKPKKKLPIRKIFLLILQNKNDVLLEKRTQKGVWEGLWSLPEISNASSKKDFRLHCLKHFNLNVEAVQLGETFRHTFTHYHLDITPVFIKVNPKKIRIMDNQQQLWYNLQNPASVGLPQPVKKILGYLHPCHV